MELFSAAHCVASAAGWDVSALSLSDARPSVSVPSTSLRSLQCSHSPPASAAEPLIVVASLLRLLALVSRSMPAVCRLLLLVPYGI